jgi:hypothetical protein
MFSFYPPKYPPFVPRYPPFPNRLGPRARGRVLVSLPISAAAQRRPKRQSRAGRPKYILGAWRGWSNLWGFGPWYRWGWFSFASTIQGMGSTDLLAIPRGRAFCYTVTFPYDGKKRHPSRAGQRWWGNNPKIALRLEGHPLRARILQKGQVLVAACYLKTGA